MELMEKRKNHTLIKYTILLQVVSTYPSNEWFLLIISKKQEKWRLVALAYVLDMSRVNSQTIYAMNKRYTSTKSFEFGWELMISLIKPHMSNRITIRVYLVILRNPPGYTLIKLNDGNSRVCRVCQKGKYGTGHKKVINILGKVKAHCSKCDHHLCDIMLSFVKNALKTSKTTT